MKKKINRSFIVVVVIIILMLGCQKKTDPSTDLAGTQFEKKSVESYQNFHHNFQTLNGETENLVELIKGKIAIVNVFATWCPPCKEEIPSFVKLYDTYKDQDVIIVGVSIDNALDVLLPFKKALSINYPIMYDPQKQLAASFGVRGIPTSFILDREGNLALRISSYASYEFFEGEIKKLL
jgi:thiol-disulfide isomerase/thioredoxin